MTNLRVNGVTQRQVFGSADIGLTIDRLRTIVQDSHLNFLIGACPLPCRRRFFLPKHLGNRVAQRLDHYEGLTSPRLLPTAGLKHSA